MELETKTINEWIRHWGYNWVPGREQLTKGIISKSEAYAQVASLAQNGDIRRG